MTSIKCHNCGFDVDKNANFCSNCGYALKDPMPEIQYFNKPTPIPTPESESVDESSFSLDSSPLQEAKSIDENTPSLQIEDEDSAELTSDVIVGEESEQEAVSTVDEETPEGMKILGLSEGVFYTLLLAIGIVAIVLFKWFNDPQWLRGDSSASQSVATDTIKADSVLVETSEKATIEPVAQDAQPVAPIPAEKASVATFKIPQQSGTPTDTAYHVIITSLKDSARAQEVASKVKYSGAYIISDGKLHKVAVFRSLKREDAQLYVDSVIKKDYPDAWLFHGTAK